MKQQILCYSATGTTQIEIDHADIDKHFSADQDGGMANKGEHFSRIGDGYEIEIWTPLTKDCPYQAYGCLTLEPYDMVTLEFVIMDQVGRLNMLKDLVPIMSQASVSYALEEIRAAIVNPGECKDVKPIAVTLSAIANGYA